MQSLNADTSTPLAPVRTAVAGWSVPDERSLWGVVVCAYALDLATTAYGLSIGLAELNPVAASLLATYGIASLVGLKAVALAAGATCRSLVRGWDAATTAIPIGLALPACAAVVVNSLAIVLAM